ncbi:MAG: CDP-2,3-bis-(O-geranylgeranyl)-sn-glycerol synthase [Candidatus Aenigmarchaeota archaeon]|nr:CDP-2,3-bis-(O-geranylgeranyl)-sn-glycerol synthase [Candidatus Aenigmarchaeota archaeon]
MDIILIILQSLWFILPAYIANSSAVFFMGEKPIDFGKNYKDGKRILGNGKTFEGTLGGLLVGTFVGFLQYILFKHFYASMTLYQFMPYSIALGFALSFGAMAGDIVESFVKRRMDIQRGGEIIWDKFDFLIGSFLFAYLFFDMSLLSVWHILFLLIFTPIIHRLFNMLAYSLKLKNVSW